MQNVTAQRRDHIGIMAGIFLVSLLITGESQAWTQGDVGGNVEIGGIISPSGPENPWLVKVGSSIYRLDMVLQENETVARHRLKQSLPVLGIRTITGLAGTFGGEAAGGIAPQITFSGLLPGKREKGRLPLELDVTRKDDSSHYLGVLRLNLLTGAEVSQKNASTGEGRRYSVWASQPGEAFYGGLARTPDEAVDNAMVQVGDVFPFYRTRYNIQGLSVEPGAKQVTEFRNENMRYSGFYGAGLVQGDEVILRFENEESATEEVWKASLRIQVAYL
ncbi:hypothetical protein C3433_24030 [Citrobacter freundii]|nr:hypothetical protein C3433_24030 [Citrobacter freundii]